MAKEAIYELSVSYESSVCPITTMEIIPLTAALPVMGVAIWCVWAAQKERCVRLWFQGDLSSVNPYW